MCEDLSDEGQVEGLAGRLDDSIAKPYDLEGVTVNLSASIGIAFAGQGNDPEELLHNADIAMYQAKRKGGGTHQVIDIHEQRRSDSSDSLLRDLGHAAELEELRLDYQPVIRTTDRRVVCVEALLRWDHPGRGLIPPTVVIPMAEQSGDIVEIGQWVLEHACVDRHRWEAKAGDETLVVSVNVSAHQLMAPGFLFAVRNILLLTDTLPKELCLEITESAFIQDAKRALAVLSELKAIGIQLALDDFGTGYSSLSYLMEYPVDVIKIDQTFIARVTESKASHAIVSKTIPSWPTSSISRSSAKESRQLSRTARSQRSSAISLSGLLPIAAHGGGDD